MFCLPFSQLPRSGEALHPLRSMNLVFQSRDYEGLSTLKCFKVAGVVFPQEDTCA